MELFLQQLKFELESVDISTLRLRQLLGELDETIVEAIVLRLQQLGDLTKSFDVRFSRDVDHVPKGIMLGVYAQEASV